MNISRILAAALLLSAFASNASLAASARDNSKDVDWSKAETVEIALDSYAFTPKTLHLKRGVPYRLHFVNKADKGHNYDAPGFFEALTVAPDDRDKVAEGKLEVDKGASADVRAMATTPGKYKVQCSHFMHTTLGMTGEAVIE